MKIVTVTFCAGVWLQLFGTLVLAQTQVCPDSAINKCVAYITEPISGSTITDQQISESCSRLSNLTLCLPMNKGCPADQPITGQVRTAIKTSLTQICSANRERLVRAATCWNGAGTSFKISACNSTFYNSLQAQNQYCDAAGVYLTCVETAVLTDCGADVMILHNTYSYAALVGFAVAKNCQILNNRCLPWNITTCLNNLNIPLGATGQGKDFLKSNMDRICGRADDVTICLNSQSCPSGNSFYQLVNTKLQSLSSAICQEKDRTSYYASYADCWMTEPVRTGVSNCNNTFRTNLETSATFCASADTFLKCTKDLVTAQCSPVSGVSVAAYFYSLLSVNATVNNCTIDSMYAPPATGAGTSSTSISTSTSISSSRSTSGSPSTSASSSTSAAVSNSGSPSASAYVSMTTTDNDSTYAPPATGAGSSSSSPSISGSASASAYVSMATTDNGNSAVLIQGAFVLVLSTAATAIFLQL